MVDCRGVDKYDKNDMNMKTTYRRHLVVADNGNADVSKYLVIFLINMRTVS